MEPLVAPLGHFPAPHPRSGEQTVPLLAGPAAVARRLPELGPVTLELRHGELRHAVTTPLHEVVPGPKGVCLRGDGCEVHLDPRRWGAVAAVARHDGLARQEWLHFSGETPGAGLDVALTPASSRRALAELIAGGGGGAENAEGAGPAERAGLGGQSLGPVELPLVRELLETVADAALPLRLEAAVPGARQAFTGVLANPVAGDGLRLHGAGFRAEVPLARVAAARLTLRRLPEGRVHAVDLVDDGGRCFLRLAGQRLPGRPEDRAWRTLLGALPAAEAAG
jgi:putative heme degradation protein